MTTGEFTASHTLAVRIGSESHTLTSGRGVAVIGRDPSATVRINDDRISRTHVRLEPRHNGWQAIDTSSNGMFIDGVRRNSVLITHPMTLHLGDAAGIPVTLTPAEPREQTAVIKSVTDSDEAEEHWDELSETDPNIAYAGRAVAARRSELDLTQRSLARDKIISAGALIALEKGRTWPRRATLAKLEEVLEWPPGTITRIRNSAPVDTGDSDVTEVITDSVQAPLMAEAVELAMHSIGAAIDALPSADSADFTTRVTPILADLRKLETVAANAARSARGTPSVVLALSAVRRRYNELMMRAAQSPTATLGQRLFGARQRAELSVDEAANAAGISTEALLDAEAERVVSPDAMAGISTLVAQLAMS